LSIEPLHKQCNQLFSLQEFVLVMFALHNIHATTHFSLYLMTQFNTESIMKSKTDHLILRLH